MTAIDERCAALFTGGDTTRLDTELIDVIEHAIGNMPRSLQTRIGPSEIGVECVRCLILKLAATDTRPDAAWLPFVGTAVHEQLERIFTADTVTSSRWLTETVVTVGTIGGTPITGSCDLFDLKHGVVIDWKIVGQTALREAKAHGPSTQYRTQVQLYGKGFQDAGYTVTEVAVFYLPRNEPSLANALFCPLPYDRAAAERALERADMFAAGLARLGLDATLAAAPPHTGGFSCAGYGQPHPTRKGAATVADLLNVTR